MIHGEPLETSLSDVSDYGDHDHATNSRNTDEEHTSSPVTLEALAEAITALSQQVAQGEEKNERTFKAFRDVFRNLDERIGTASSGGEDADASLRLSGIETTLAQVSGRVEDLADNFAALSGDIESTRAIAEAAQGESGEPDFDAQALAGNIAAIEEAASGMTAQMEDLQSTHREADMAHREALLALKDRLVAAETRHDEATQKISHAVSVVAERIDDLSGQIAEHETRFTSASYAPAAATAPDGSVAPYIANAERELAEARSGGASVDVFDRIARAAESEFENRDEPRPEHPAVNGDDRRVGTKKWTPSKAIKKRMADLEAMQTKAPEPAPEAESKAEAAEVAAPEAAKVAETPPPVPEAPVMVKTRRRKPEPEPEPELTAAPEAEADEEDDTDKLATVPGPRGRRRDRARKSSMDEDFEQAFVEEEGPSIGGLRAKLRKQSKPAPAAPEPQMVEEKLGAVTADVEEDAPKPAKLGFFKRFLSRNSAKRSDDEMLDDEDESDLMSAFDDGLDNVDSEADEDWEDVVRGERKKSMLLPIAIVLGAALIGGGYFVWTRMGG